MKEIFIVTSYYPPEIGAASNRIMHMAEGLQSHGYDVTVITPMPNYPTGKIFKKFKGKFVHKSLLNRVKVVRLWIYPSISKNKILRLFAMLSYSLSLMLYYLIHNIPKTVIVQCPPLIVAFTSMLLLKSKSRKLILNVSDLWPMAGLELGALKEGAFVDVLRKIERFNYKRADLVLGQSNEILSHIKELAPKKPLFLYRNFPVIKFVEPYAPPRTGVNKIKLVYAGLLGVAQGLLEVCKNLDFTKSELHIYGDGAERHQIEEFLGSHTHLPIRYHGNLKRQELHKELVKYDLTLIPLKRRIYGSVPSKIFEYAKLGLPIMYFGGGEGEAIILKYDLGYIAEAGNYSHLNTVLNSVKLGDLTVENRNRIIRVSVNNFNLERQLQSLGSVI